MKSANRRPDRRHANATTMTTTRATRPFPAAPLRLFGAGLAAALALSGCSILDEKPKTPTVQYAPDPRVPADPSWPQANWQLSVSVPSAARMIDSLRIAVRPSGDEVQVYKGAAWAKLPSNMIEDALLRTLEDSGKIAAVARQGSGIGADYKLVLDLRRFESDYAGNAVPSAVIEINAKLFHNVDQKVVASRTFLQSTPAATTEVRDVVAAFERSLAAGTGEIAGWALVSGDAHEKSHKR
ncbi:cholesterol transport system auxiliary component [Lysobacter sp. yr284]|uniref:ABC-type transport auxiliary lipoprotein family protein n=1 Tax=Lysobacter sp. yr284 TaxID=1761791 RepID=UPI00089D5CA3|nr:ABC-type transport auxiliary lipoprotein family protein [Lysobacter sp. yr284]SDY61896.1 cholesterol transport system auxiliary component [Lysobacter sp. yr284]